MSSSYGFYIHNDSGDVVLTDEYVIYQLFEETDLVGTYNATYNCYSFIVDTSTVQFFKLNVGDWVGRCHNNEVISNQAVIRTRVLKTADTIIRPSGEYGMKLFNSSGILTYSSSSPVGGIRESMLVNHFYVGSPTFTSSPPPTHNKDYSWFCITTTIVASADFGIGNGTAVPVIGKYSTTQLSIGYFRQYSSIMFALNDTTNVNNISVLCA